MKKNTRPQTRECVECQFSELDTAMGTLLCLKNHKPRFYKPLYFNDQVPWGWKRKCKDFLPTCF